jgi:hypothetical protein
MDWKELTKSQQEAAMKLCYTQELWDGNDCINVSNKGTEQPTDRQTPVLDQYEDSDWKELPDWVREAAEGIGYTKKLWNKDKEPGVCEKDWEELTISQQEAAKMLGYTKEVWDDECDNYCASSNGFSGSNNIARNEAQRRTTDIRLKDVHKNHKWTIYCIQLYTETKDYKFRITEEMGLSMYANRPLEANEFIVRSPVGPCVHEGLFEVSKDGVLSEERRRFADRFLEWHCTHGKTDRVGAQNAQLTIELQDFFNPSITSKEHRMLPRLEFPVYDLEIFEHEIVIAEFVAPPWNPDHELPPSRRFDVLHYDEGLVGLDGEEGYDPHKLKRPPTLCGMEQRSLELPGHFTNHCCGGSSTAYDFLRLGEDGRVFSLSGTEAEVRTEGNELPEWLSNEIAAKKRSVEKVQFSHLTARRALEPGTEITSDYSRWHWCNSDMAYYGESRRTPCGYFLGSPDSERWDWDELSPKIKRAARILGYNPAMWESEMIPSIMKQPWRKLSLQEQEAAINLTGHTKDSWDARKEVETFDVDEDDDDSVVSLMELNWTELSEDQKKAAELIGHTETTWMEGGHEDVLGDDLYFYNLRPEVRDAMAVLGITEVNWEEADAEDGECGDAEPWFECLCGDTDCHCSPERGGFRGVKYFPLEEQRKLAPLCEPWVQQQFQWRMYQLVQEEQETKKQKPM